MTPQYPTSSFILCASILTIFQGLHWSNSAVAARYCKCLIFFLFFFSNHGFLINSETQGGVPSLTVIKYWTKINNAKLMMKFISIMKPQTNDGAHLQVPSKIIFRNHFWCRSFFNQHPCPLINNEASGDDWKQSKLRPITRDAEVKCPFPDFAYFCFRRRWVNNCQGV